METWSIKIEHEPLEQIQKSCRDYNRGLLGIHHFDWDSKAIEFQAENLFDEIGIEPTDPRELLEMRFGEF